MPGLIGTLYTGISGLNISQDQINVTSHNIANASTDGYSRQRATIHTRTPYCMPSMDSTAGPGQFGTGADVTSVDRIRDHFLDFQIRENTSKYGRLNTTNNFLNEIESMISTDSGISQSIDNFYGTIQQYTTDSTKTSTTAIVNTAKTLTDNLNSIYKGLNDLTKNVQTNMQDDVSSINDMLDKIDNLNQQIMEVKMGHKEPNDLEDSRDLLLDQLSEKFGISVDRSPDFDGEDLSAIDIPAGSKIVGKLVKSVEHDDGINRFSYVDSLTKTNDTPVSGTKGSPNAIYSYNVAYYKLGDKSTNAKEVDLTVNMTESQAKSLEQNRILWADKNGYALKAGDGTTELNGSETGLTYNDLAVFTPADGDVSGEQTVQGDIKDYTDRLNRIAKAIALTMNTISSGMTNPTASQPGSKTPDLDYDPIFVNAEYKSASGSFDPSDYFGKTGATGKNWEDYINAGNITVNQALLNSTNPELKVRSNDDQYKFPSDNINKDGTTDHNRALAMAQAEQVALKIQDIDPDVYSRNQFISKLSPDSNGVNTVTSDPSGISLHDYFKNLINTLGTDNQEAITNLRTQSVSLNSIKQTREETSGVSLDEEMTNLIQYSHGYQANAKIISTIDQLLDVVINNLKR